MSNPICPMCGAEMVIRIARKGSFIGKNFYGCSNFPKCKHIINIDQNDTKGRDEVNRSEGRYINEIATPKFIQAREKYQGCQVRFYETLALPFEFLQEVNSGNIDRNNLRNFSKWRVDYPINNVEVLNGEIRHVLNIAYKILTRGGITLISPLIESELRKWFNVDNANISTFNINNLFCHVIPEKSSKIWFDGLGTEKDFYENILYDLLGPYFKQHIIPQVHFSSLIKDREIDISLMQQRVDFIISLPDKKLAIELDDSEHIRHQSRDKYRDMLLEEGGFEVIRIPNDEIENRGGTQLQKLYSVSNDYKTEQIKELSNIDLYVLAIKMSHQIQITILEAMLNGLVNTKYDKIYFDASSVVFNEEDIQFILDILAKDLHKLLENIALLYETRLQIQDIKIQTFTSQQDGILITYSDNLSAGIPKFVIQDIFFRDPIAIYSRPVKPVKLNTPDKENLEFFLQYIFRKDNFWEGQYDAISRALTGKDSIVLLPTGSGKSIAFQLASMLLPGITIVIDPILSLIDDQIDNLERVGIDRTIGITSQITNPQTRAQIISAFGQGQYLFCYIAPERFQTEEFRNSLRTLTTTSPVSLIAIDEAHCVSEWGHDFRTAYLNIGRISRGYCKFEGNIPPLLALTGTASNSVLRDIQRELQIEDFDAIITPKTFDRKELNFTVRQCLSEEKMEVLKGLLKGYIPDKFGMSTSSFYQTRGKHTKSGLIFCPHVDGNYGVVENAKKISDEIGVEANYYGGKTPRGWQPLEWNAYKRQIATNFKNNGFSLLVATKSFGMGIDKPNIRYTVHLGLPNSIESFYQEAGRAGRDRQKAECIVIISNDYKDRSNKLLDMRTPPDTISTILKEVSWDTDDDVTRAMWFHGQAFRGIKNELEDVNKVIKSIGDFSKRRTINVAIHKSNRNSIEKGVHRLLVLGIIEDYTIDYSSNEFHITLSGSNKEKIIDSYAKYVSGYNKGRVLKEVNKIIQFMDDEFNEFIKESCRILIEFIYDTVEKGRRRALREMLSLAEDANSSYDQDRIVRERVLRYLEATYAEEIDKILNDADTGLNQIKRLIDGYETETGEIIGGIRSPKDAMEIRGQVARYLESTPDHPGLLFLRALAEVFCTNYDEEIIFQNIISAAGFAQHLYNIDENSVFEMITWILIRIYERNPSTYSNIVQRLLYDLNNKNFARTIIENKDTIENMIFEPSVYLLSQCSQEAVNLNW